MKILITTDLFSVSTNGVVTSVKNLIEELEAKGHEIRVLTLSESIHSHKDGKVYYIRSMPFRVYPNIRMPLSYRHKLIAELIEWRPDVIHSQCEFFSFQYARRISKLTGAPIVHTYHTLYEQYVKYLIPSRRIGKSVVRVVSRKRLKRCSLVIAPTGKVEDALRGYGLSNDISVVPSGISLDQHKRRISQEERSEMRKNLGISEDDTVLINLGRLGTEKNLDELIDFYAKAYDQNNNLKFLIVGDGPAREDLEARCKKLGISSCVVFTGMVKPEEVQKYYQLGDVFVSASTSETQGLTYVEAAANGLPLLCRDDLCLKDVLR
ncbi:MAG: glycosyltransferase, partial [Clostridia bacterium]|nr:glycosyltransferase [Clostridia bacterium]